MFTVYICLLAVWHSCTSESLVETETHFTITWNVEGTVNLGGWLHIKMVYLP